MKLKIFLNFITEKIRKMENKIGAKFVTIKEHYNIEKKIKIGF